MNPPHNSNQNPAAVQQGNSVVNQQMGVPNPQQMSNGNVGGLFPNNRPIAPPSSIMNFPNQPFPLQTAMGQFPNGVGGFNSQQNFMPFPVNQFNPSPQQQGQFFSHNSMNPTAYSQNVGLPNEQVLLQSAIQNICQLLQLQNPNYSQFVPGNVSMFQNQIANVLGPQNPGFAANQQFAMPNGPVQHANQGQQRFVSPMIDVNAANRLPNMGQQLQGNPLLPNGSGSVQTQQAQNLLLTNFQNQTPNSVGPQNPSFLVNQLLGMANSNGPVQHGQQRFGSPMIDVEASKPSANTGQQLQGSSLLPHASGSVETRQAQNLCPTLTNFQENHGKMPANVNSEWAGPQHKNFTGHKRNDASQKGFKSQFHHTKHAKEKFGIHNGNMNKGCNRNAAANSISPSSINQTHVKKKVPSLKYTDQEVKQWREARRKHYPTSANMEKKHMEKHTLPEVTNQEAKLRCQQLTEILAKQAELGCEVADIPLPYLSGSDKQSPGGQKHERGRHKKGKSHNKRGTRLQDDRMSKKRRAGDPDLFKASNQTNVLKPNKREPSLLQKLLTRDVKRDKNHLLQVFRFIAANGFFTGEPGKSLRFPSVIVRETSPDVAEETLRKKAVEILDFDCDEGKHNGEEQLGKPKEEEGEITD